MDMSTAPAQRPTNNTSSAKKKKPELEFVNNSEGKWTIIGFQLLIAVQIMVEINAAE